MIALLIKLFSVFQRATEAASVIAPLLKQFLLTRSANRFINSVFFLSECQSLVNNVVDVATDWLLLKSGCTHAPLLLPFVTSHDHSQSQAKNLFCVKKGLFLFPPWKLF